MSAAKKTKKREEFNLQEMEVPGIVMFALWTLATVLWQSMGEIMALFFFGYIGTSVGIGLGYLPACAAHRPDRSDLDYRATWRLEPICMAVLYLLRIRIGR